MTKPQQSVQQIPGRGAKSFSGEIQKYSYSDDGSLLICRLRTATGFVTAEIPATEQSRIDLRHLPCAVQVQGHWYRKRFNGWWYFSVSSYQRMNEGVVSQAERESLRTVIKAMRPELRDFVLEVLHSPAGVDFRHAPASLHHHHNRVGGLLIHSVECALLVKDVAYTRMLKDEADICLVAALFHDLGKVSVYDGGGRLTDEGHYGTHESLTIELLAPFIARLAERWSEGANLLRSILHGKRSGKFHAFPGALLVNAMDRFSAANDQAERMFADRPPRHGFAYDASHSQGYLRLKAGAA